MRLKSIKLAGFKSFVDPTTVHFPGNLTAIVGPNGSGKSNIIDAIRWVMGESSAKYLRGESMADVIFNGSAHRKPVGQASIELLFDNSIESLGGQYANYPQIALKRVVDRDGQSDYFLNGTRCRRRDITDLFLGTGLGPRSYAIIMQDTISRIIEAKPEELRTYLEEVAGISKYKERRKETEQRISHTKENLERLIDLRDEVAKQLDHLKKQAKTAERYKELKSQERFSSAALFTIQWQSLRCNLEELLKQENVHLLTIENLLSQQRSLDVVFEEKRLLQIEATDDVNALQSSFYQIGAEVARLEQNKLHAQEKARELEANFARTTKLLAEAEITQKNEVERLNQLESKSEKLLPELESLQIQKQELTEHCRQAEVATISLQQEWEIFQQQSAESLKKAEVQKTRIEHLEKNLNEIRAHQQKLEAEKSTIDCQKISQEINELEEKLSQVNQQYETQLSIQKDLKQAIVDKKQENQHYSQQLHHSRSQLQEIKGTHSALEALQKAALGKNNTKIAAWLQEHSLAENSRFAEIIQVETGWEKAAETVLGFYLEAICVDKFNINTSVASLPMGHITFVCPEENKAINQQISATTLAAKIKGMETFLPSLTYVYAVETLEDAYKIIQQLKSYESIITKDGVWLGAGFLHFTKDDNIKGGVIQRKKDLTALDLKITNVMDDIKNCEEKLRIAAEVMKQMESDLEKHQTHLRETTTDIANFQAQIRIKQMELSQKNHRLVQINDNFLEADHKINQTINELESSRQIWQQALQQLESQTIDRSSLENKKQQARNEYDNAKQNLNKISETYQKTEIEFHTLKNEIQLLTQNIQRTKDQCNNLRIENNKLHDLINQEENPLGKIQAELSEFLEKQLEFEKKLSAAKNHLSTLEQEISSLTTTRQGILNDIQQERSKLENIRLEAKSVEVRSISFAERIAEYEFTLEELVAFVENAEENQLQLQLEELQKKISRLGAINLAAIDEYQVTAERKNYLDSQHSDLNQALETLENAIRKIDHETRQRFKEIYEKVNTHFSLLFPKIFNGGSASLELTASDLLETGVIVTARPPGKRNSTIHLLSGGEKALTAIALVFALFQINPAPFCLLDEVDAPLDDVNVGRLCGLVKEMSKDVQFIFVSHNKLAIQMADHLTGITMREPGISRLVAVDIEAAIAMTGA